MVIELKVGNTAPSINAHSDSNHELIFFDGSKDAHLFLINNFISLLSDIVLTVDGQLANGSYSFTFLGPEVESLIEWEVFFSLIRDSVQSIWSSVLVNLHLNFQSGIIFVVATFELITVAKLGDDGILMESTEKTESNRLQLLICLGLQNFIWRVLNVPDWNLLKEQLLL